MSCEKCAETRTNIMASLSQIKAEICEKYVDSEHTICAAITDVCCYIDKIIDDIAASVPNVKIEFEVNFLGETSTTTHAIIDEVKDEINYDDGCDALTQAESEPEAYSDRSDDEYESTNGW